MVDINRLARTAAKAAVRIARDNPEAVVKGVDTVGGLVDRSTKGRFHDQIVRGQGMARDRLSKGQQPTRTETPETPVTPGTQPAPSTPTEGTATEGRAPGQVS